MRRKQPIAPSDRSSQPEAPDPWRDDDPNQPPVLRCWSCLGAIRIPVDRWQLDLRQNGIPFYWHICKRCWDGLPAEKRIEISARFAGPAEGGMGDWHLRREVEAAARAVKSVVRKAEKFLEVLERMARRQEKEEADAEQTLDDTVGDPLVDDDWWKRDKAD